VDLRETDNKQAMTYMYQISNSVYSIEIYCTFAILLLGQILLLFSPLTYIITLVKRGPCIIPTYRVLTNEFTFFEQISLSGTRKCCFYMGLTNPVFYNLARETTTPLSQVRFRGLNRMCTPSIHMAISVLFIMITSPKIFIRVQKTLHFIFQMSFLHL
jgi:hypothetical protein